MSGERQLRRQRKDLTTVGTVLRLARERHVRRDHACRGHVCELDGTGGDRCEGSAVGGEKYEANQIFANGCTAPNAIDDRAGKFDALQFHRPGYRRGRVAADFVIRTFAQVRFAELPKRIVEEARGGAATVSGNLFADASAVKAPEEDHVETCAHVHRCDWR